MGILVGLGALWVLIYLLGAPAQLATLAVIGGGCALIVRAFRRHGVGGGLGKGARHGVGWLLGQAGGVLTGAAGGVLALLDEEGKRWVRLAVSGALLWGGSWLALHLLGWAPRVLVVLLLLILLWAYSVVRAIKATMRNSVEQARRRKAERDFRERLDKLPARLAQLQTQAVAGARTYLGRGIPLERLAELRSRYPDDKELARWVKEEEAAMTWHQPGADFEPVVPAAGKAGRWAAGRGRRFGRGLRDGWRRRGGPPQDEGKSQ